MCRLSALIFLLVGLLVNSNIALAQKQLNTGNSGTESSQKFTPSLWQHDIRELKKHLMDAHPNLFHQQNKAHIISSVCHVPALCHPKLIGLQQSLIVSGPDVYIPEHKRIVAKP